MNEEDRKASGRAFYAVVYFEAAPGKSVKISLNGGGSFRIGKGLNKVLVECTTDGWFTANDKESFASERGLDRLEGREEGGWPGGDERHGLDGDGDCGRLLRLMDSVEVALGKDISENSIYKVQSSSVFAVFSASIRVPVLFCIFSSLPSPSLSL